MELTIYFVGTDTADAISRFPFDSYESAASYARDNEGTFIYSAPATVDLSLIERS